MENNSFYKKINNFLNKNIILVFIGGGFIICTLNGKNYKYNASTASYISEPILYRKMGANDKIETLSINTSNISYQNKVNNKKIVKNFTLSIIVKDINVAKNELEKKLNEYNGYVNNFYSYEYSDKKALNIEMKVPSEKADAYLLFLKKNGYVKSENFSSIDYSEQYSDNENKLKNLYARRDKLREMMNIKTKSLADILAVDKELNNTQMEIEMLEKKNIKIQKYVDYASVNVTLEPEITKDKEQQQWNFKKVIFNALNILILFCHVFIQYFVIFIVFLPLFITFTVLVIVFKKIYLYLKNKNK